MVAALNLRLGHWSSQRCRKVVPCRMQRNWVHRVRHLGFETGLGGKALTPPGYRAVKPMKKASRFVFSATTVATAAYFVAAATDQSAVPGLSREIVRTAWTAVAPILRGLSS